MSSVPIAPNGQAAPLAAGGGRFGSSTAYFVLCLLMLVTALLAVALKPVAIARDKQPDLEAMVPTAFGEWRAVADEQQVQPTESQQKTLTEIYDQILSRTYVNGKGERMMLMITYGAKQTNELKVHRQEVCYEAQGYTINDLHSETDNLASRPVALTRMFAVSGRRQEPVTYWFTMGGKVVLSRSERFIRQIKLGLTGQIPDGVLVRVSNLNGDKDVSYRAHLEFMNALLEAMTPQSASHLVGAMGAGT